MFLSGVKVGKRKRKSKEIKKLDGGKQESIQLINESCHKDTKSAQYTTTTITTISSRFDHDSSTISSSKKFIHSDISDISKSIHELKEEEIRNKHKSIDEVYAQNILKLRNSNDNNDDGLEEDDIDTANTIKLFNTTAKSSAKRQNTAHLESLITKYWWWMESPSFHKHMLLSLGDHVSLVKAPIHLSLTNDHCYLVPIKYAESLVSCDKEVWNEIYNFQSSLKQMYEKENKSVLYVETVLPSKGCWHTKMEVIPVPKHIEQDAPLYFKSALLEQCNDNNTHNKILGTSREKGIQHTIPNKNFPYIHVQWDNGNSGYVYLIDNSNNQHIFPKDFGVDIIANIMGLDPLRFNRKNKKVFGGSKEDEEKKHVLDFCSRFKAHDWTYELDKEESKDH